jgi:type IV pilus assembly protein PilY1
VKPRKPEVSFMKNQRKNRATVLQYMIFLAGLITFLIAPASIAFEPQTNVFSAPKNPPAGFSQIVEPNVLLLIDTSGSMTFFMDNDSSTYGDGTNPCYLNGSNSLYYGKDSNPGRNTSGNNDPSVDFNYHPLLREIPTDQISDTNDNFTGVFSYKIETKTGQRWIPDEWGKVREDEAQPSVPYSDKKKDESFRWVWRDVSHSWTDHRWILERRDPDKNNYNPVNSQSLVPSLPANYRYIVDAGENWAYSSRGLEILRVSGHNETYTYNGYTYKYPNDSRMYTLKNVLYRILGDQTLVGDLRLGLSAYYQDYYSSGSGGDWYNWWPNNDGNSQRITWRDDSTRRARLHEGFASTTKSPAHLDKIREWFDGTESSSNPEFRGDGATPLVASIVNNSYFDPEKPIGSYIGWPVKAWNNPDCALDFFKIRGDNPTITEWCQDNWLIVLTDGEDSYENYTNTAQVTRTLYNADLGVENARPVKTMVIGLINPSTQSTLASTLNDMADYGDDGSLNGSATAFFPQNMAELMEAFKTIFQTIQDIAATGSAPLVNPPKTLGGAGKVYSAGFKPKIVQQWMGFLSSYVISDDVVIPDTNWVGDAGTLLDAKKYDTRNIYTADWDTGTAGKVVTNLKAFSSDNSSALKPFFAGDLSITDTAIKKFIRWVQGSDEWDETDGDQRWKLGDPYHVGIVEVGAPQSLITDPLYRVFAEDSTVKDRTRVVYMHANDGMVHAFNSANGNEEWAFIPPNVLNYPRLIGTKLGSDDTLREVKESTPKYLLDGPLVAEDILLDGSYKTVLLGGLGRAGAGLYTLDITDPAKPKFLWAMENNCYYSGGNGEGILRTENSTFMRWLGGTGTASSTLSSVDSSSSTVPGKLRLTVSTPFIGTVDFESLSGIDTKWVALLGGGAKSKPLLENDAGGKAVIVLDMKDGSLVKEISHGDLGSVVAPLAVEAGPRPMRIRKYYLGDDIGAIFEGDLSPYDSTEWTLAKVFTPGDGAAADDLFTIPYALEVGMINNRKWLFWGTGDPDFLFGEKEGKCYVFAMNRSLAGDSAFTLANLPPLENVSGDQYNDTVAVSINGWRLPLGTGEIVSTPPVLFRGYIFFATYTANTDPCLVGKSNFYIMKADTGLGGFVTYTGDEITSWKKNVTLDATKISGITVTGGKVYVGVTSFSNASNPQTVLGGFTGNISLSGNLLVFDVPENIMTDDSGGSSTKTEPAYWRDWKP